MISEFPVLICIGKANSCGNGCVQGWCQCLTHMNWCSTDAWPDYKPCWQPVSTSLACPPALGFAYVFAQGRSLWCLLRICTPSAPILDYTIKVVYCGSTVFSTVAVLCPVLWQYWCQYCGSTKLVHFCTAGGQAVALDGPIWYQFGTNWAPIWYNSVLHGGQAVALDGTIWYQYGTIQKRPGASASRVCLIWVFGNTQKIPPPLIRKKNWCFAHFSFVN